MSSPDSAADLLLATGRSAAFLVCRVIPVTTAGFLLTAASPLRAQDGWSGWTTIAGHPGGQGCSVDFQYRRREDKSKDEPHYQYWYQSRNSCGDDAKLKLIMHRTDGMIETMRVPAGKTVKSWTFATSLTGAHLVGWGSGGTQPTAPAADPRREGAVATALSALSEWSGKAQGAVAKQNGWLRQKLPGPGLLVESYGRALNRARQDATRLQGLLDRVNNNATAFNAEQLQHATGSLRTDMAEVARLGTQVDAQVAMNERAEQRRLDAMRAQKAREEQDRQVNANRRRSKTIQEAADKAGSDIKAVIERQAKRDRDEREATIRQREIDEAQEDQDQAEADAREAERIARERLRVRARDAAQAPEQDERAREREEMYRRQRKAAADTASTQ
jgi:hypothetical protein